MENNRNLRGPLIIDIKLSTDFSIRAYKNGLLSVVNRTAQAIEKMINSYMNGDLDGMVKKVSNYKITNGGRTAHIDRNLKNEFGIKAYNDGLIKHPQYVARLIESMMRSYLEGEFDKVLHYEQNTLEKDN